MRAHVMLEQSDQDSLATSKRDQRPAQRDSSRPVPEAVHDVLRSSGRPLDAATRGFMEGRFGHDFSRVRVHADAPAARAASSLGARAYTARHDVVFGAGEYAPSTEHGRRLLAHELTHVVQQSGVQPKGAIGFPGDAHETHADAVADRVASGRNARPNLHQMPSLAPHAFQMQPNPKAKQTPHQDDKPSGYDPADNFKNVMADWSATDKLKAPIVKELAHAYVNRRGFHFYLPEEIAKENRKNNIWVPENEPGEQEVYWAIYGALDLKKGGQAYNASDWKLEFPEGRKKTHYEKLDLIADHVIDDTRDKVVEEAVKGGIVSLSAKFLSEDAALLVEALIPGFAEVYGAITLVVGLVELVKALQEPAELSKSEQRTADIVASVKKWAQGRQDAADAKAQKKPVKNYHLTDGKSYDTPGTLRSVGTFGTTTGQGG